MEGNRYVDDVTEAEGALPTMPEFLSAWSLESVMRRAGKELNRQLGTLAWTAEELALLEREYRRYMLLQARFPGACLPPSRPVDAVWHAHLAFTADYEAFCLKIAGRFIHHRPSQSEEERRHLRDRYPMTLSLYREHFGAEPPLAVWPTEMSPECCDCCGDIRP